MLPYLTSITGYSVVFRPEILKKLSIRVHSAVVRQSSDSRQEFSGIHYAGNVCPA